MTWQQLRAAEITRIFWESRRAEMVSWLVREKRFNPKGAAICANSFIETMVFVAGEIGEPQFKSRHQ